MQILISWSRVPSKSRFRSFVKILFWIENPLLWRGIRDGQNSCCTCHNTKGWKYICVLRKQAGNKLTVHSSFLCTYSVLRFWFRWFYTEKTHWKLHLEKTSEAFNLRPNQRTCVRGRKKPSVGKTLYHGAKNVKKMLKRTKISNQGCPTSPPPPPQALTKCALFVVFLIIGNQAIRDSNQKKKSWKS